MDHGVFLRGRLVVLFDPIWVRLLGRSDSMVEGLWRVEILLVVGLEAGR
jgi:hypothetical protein